MNLRYKWVTCAQCATRFQVTPTSDYYGATNDHDGLCEACLVGDLPVHTVRVVGGVVTRCEPPSRSEAGDGER
jgi:hypothetical protein